MYDYRQHSIYSLLWTDCPIVQFQCYFFHIFVPLGSSFEHSTLICYSGQRLRTRPLSRGWIRTAPSRPTETLIQLMQSGTRWRTRNRSRMELETRCCRMPWIRSISTPTTLTRCWESCQGTRLLLRLACGPSSLLRRRVLSRLLGMYLHRLTPLKHFPSLCILYLYNCDTEKTFVMQAPERRRVWF
jgi:hypothetical protein